jgi:small-conductance mechanosensitive channel
MPADPTAIVTAARRRRELTRAKAVQALRELDRAGTPVTFGVVAQAAGVSRSWLYAQPDVRAEIQRLREATLRAPTPPIPAAQRATTDSLRQRLETTHERIRQLTEENQRLRRQLAHALGERRHPAIPREEHKPNPAPANIAPQ